MNLHNNYNFNNLTSKRHFFSYTVLLQIKYSHRISFNQIDLFPVFHRAVYMKIDYNIRISVAIFTSLHLLISISIITQFSMKFFYIFISQDMSGLCVMRTNNFLVLFLVFIKFMINTIKHHAT